MIKNPICNAVAAATYIALIVLLIAYVGENAQTNNKILAPIAFLSLFTLSAAVMGYLFLLQPVTLYLDGKKKEAVAFFTKTIASFAIITAIILVGAFSGLFS